jgi:hypothetical protein
MIVFQVPAGMPEHNRFANKMGNYLEQRLGRELVVLYDTFRYISPEMAFAQYKEIPFDLPAARSEVLGVDVPVEWTV